MDADAAASCADAQIFNTSRLKAKIEDGSTGFPNRCPITQVSSDVPYILADDVFALKTWLLKPYRRRMLTREERIANYRISRDRRMVENAFDIMTSRFRVLLTTMEQPLETVREIVLTFGVLHNILKSQYNSQHGGQQPEDGEVVGDGQLVGGDGNGGHNRNPAREATRQSDYLKDYFNNGGAVEQTNKHTN